MERPANYYRDKIAKRREPRGKNRRVEFPAPEVRAQRQIDAAEVMKCLRGVCHG